MDNKTQERIKADAAGLTDRIKLEAKQFAFYNYCSSAHNPAADFENIETWPYAAQVAYYAISNYMSGDQLHWPYNTKTIPMDLKDVAFETALEQWKGGKPDRPCPHCGKELSRDRNLCCRECGKEVEDVCTCSLSHLAAHGECYKCPGRHTRSNLTNPQK